MWATSPLGVVVRSVICGVYLFICLFNYLFFPPSYIALWYFKIPHRPASKRVSWYLETSPLSWLPPQDGSLSLTLLSLFLSFIFCPTSFWRQLTAFLGAWCPPPAFRSCFIEFDQAFKWSFNEFVGEKVVSPSYSSTILGLPPSNAFLSASDTSSFFPPSQ